MSNERYPVFLALSDRGVKAAVTSLVLLSIGLVLRDAILVTSSLVLAGIMVIQYLRLRGVLDNLEKTLILSPNEITESLVAGEEFHTEIHVESKLSLDCELSSSVDSLFFEQGSGDSKVRKRKLVFKPLLSGNYVDTSIHLATQDRFKLVKGERDLPFTINMRVYPRVYPVAVRAFEFLYEAGASGTGSSPMQMRGRGLEYYESREYVPGDPLNVFDWKATARLARPIVKEYLVEGGRGVGILFDSTAPDPVSLDILSSEFLRGVLSLAYGQVTVTILTLKDGLLRAEESLSSPVGAVETALKIALAGNLEEFFEYYSVIEPLKSKALRRISGKITRARDARNKSWRGWDKEQTLLIVSSLTGDPVPLLESIHNGRTQMSILQPTKPWLWAGGLPDSLRLREHHDKTTRIFEREGVKIVFRFEEAIDRLIMTRRMPLIKT